MPGTRGQKPSAGTRGWWCRTWRNIAGSRAREAYQETGLLDLPPGFPVWRRDRTYEIAGRSVDVHETWLIHGVDHFTPTPARLTENEPRSILGFRWWQAQGLVEAMETVFPPQLGSLLVNLLTDGVPAEPIDISVRRSNC